MARALALAALVLAALSFGIGARGLLEPSEGRYGSIAAEMARSGDWIVPRLNGVEHFEKPPLATWAMALSLELFGESELALRLPGVLAAALCVLVAFRLGRAQGAGGWAVLLALASPLFFVMARAVTTDVYLAGCSALSLYGTVVSLDEGRSPAVRARALTGAALAAALGFLVKGPVILILTLLPALIEALWSRDFARARRFFAPSRIALFAAVALPWFVIASLRVPGLFGWFLGNRAIGALRSSDHFHGGSIVYYVPVLLLGVLPASWILLLLPRAVWKELLAARERRLFLCALLVPFVFFSLSASKLATYALPLVIPASVLGASAIAHGHERRGVLGAAWSLLVLPLIALGIGLARGSFEALPATAATFLVLAAITATAGALAVVRMAGRRRTGTACAVLCGAVVATLLLSLHAFALGESRLVRGGSGREIARRLEHLAADGRPILGYRCFLRSLPFYTGRNMLLADFYKPDVTYERDFSAVDVAGPEALRSLLARGPVAILCRTRQTAQLEREVGPLVHVDELGSYTLLSNAELP